MPLGARLGTCRSAYAFAYATSAHRSAYAVQRMLLGVCHLAYAAQHMLGSGMLDGMLGGMTDGIASSIGK